MELTAAIQEALISLLCFDSDPRGAKFVRTLVTHKVFDAYFRDIAKAAEEYLTKYGEPAGEHTLDIIESLAAREPDSASIYRRIYQSLEQTRASINREYVLAQAIGFARKQRVKAAITGAINILEQDDSEKGVTEAESLLLRSSKDSLSLFDPGTVLFDPQRSLSFLSDDVEVFPTGIRELDEHNLGPARSTLHVFVGLPNRGKTWWLVQLGKSALLNRLRVLHVTLEMSEKKVCQRYMQALFSISKREETVTKHIFEKDAEGRFVSLDVSEVTDRPAFSDPGIKKFLLGRLDTHKRRPPLVVKQFPTGSLTVGELEAYLDGLEGSISFIPDLILVDYPDLMSVETAHYRLDIGRIYKELRGIAIKRNVGVAVVCQSNRDGESARLLTMKNVAEDFSKVATGDNVITYNQTDDEYGLGLARLHVAKAREDARSFTVLVSQAYAIGQFCLDSVRMSSSYWTHVKAEAAGDESEDEDD